VGTELALPILIRVRDDRGHAAPNAAVHVDVSASGAGVDNPNPVSNDSGFVWVYWTLGTVAQKEQIVVRLTTGSTASITVSATAFAGSAQALRVTNSPLATTRNGDAIAQPPTVAVVDRFGNPTSAPNVAVTAAIAPGIAKRSVKGTTTATTNDAGIATFNGLAVAGDTGTVTLLFSAQGLVAASATVLLTPGPPARIDAVGTGAVSAVVFDAGPAVQVRVVDATGNGLRGVDVRFTFPTNNGPVTVQSDASGVAAFTGWIAPPSVGTYSLVASVTGLPDLVITVTARPRPPSKLSSLTPTSIAGNAGDATGDISVRATDAVGGNVAGVTVTFALGGTTVKDVVTDGEGIATLSGWKLPSTPGTYRATATAAGLPSVNFDLAVSLGPPSKLELIAFPTSPQVNTVSQLTVRVTDAVGNIEPLATVQWQALTAGVTVSPTATTADSSGVVSVVVNFSTVATTVRIRASLGGAARDFSFVLQPGPMAAFETPVVFLNLGVNTPFSVVLRALDQWGNSVPNAPISSFVNYPSPYSPMSPSSPFTDANGRVTLTGFTGASPGVETFYVYGGNNGTMATVRVTVF
jgi:hypothetical protein